MNACRFGAIGMNEYGVAEVDEEKCIGCGACAKACPKKLIQIRLQDNSILPLCSNRDKGYDPATRIGARTQCDVSCIACGLCVRSCPANAIQIQEQHAVIDQNTCLNCGMCATVCPPACDRGQAGHRGKLQVKIYIRCRSGLNTGCSGRICFKYYFFVSAFSRS